MKIGAPYTPLPLEGNALFFPSTLGGGNWGGVSIDPSLGLLFVNVMHIGQWGHMEKRGEEYARTSAYGPYARFWNRETHIPCQNPPFGEMIAVDLASGDIAWRAPLGRIEALEAIGVRDTGTLNLGGSIATAGGLVFIGATNDARFRAFDAKAGKVLWETKLEANGHSSPMTYMGRDGRQYVALMAAERRSLLWRAGEQHAGGVRAARCTSQAAAGCGFEGGCGGGRRPSRPAAGGSLRPGSRCRRAARRRWSIRPAAPAVTAWRW